MVVRSGQDTIAQLLAIAVALIFCLGIAIGIVVGFNISSNLIPPEVLLSGLGAASGGFLAIVVVIFLIFVARQSKPNDQKSSQELQAPDWSKTDVRMVQEIIREAEITIQGQVTLAISADQRATVLAGIYATAGTAIIAGVGTAAATMGESLPISLVIGAVIATALFLGGSYSCVMAILPTSFYLPGSHPESWYEDVNEGRYLKDALGEASENYQGYIKSNNDTLSRNAVQFKRGAFLGISAPFFGVLIWLTLYLL